MILRKLLPAIIALIPLILHGQTGEDKTALLMIDIQEFYFAGGSSELVEPDRAAANAARILQDFRNSDQLVIHVKHGTGPQGNIHASVSPVAGEPVFVKEEVNSFLNTGLLGFLLEKKVKKLVFCGMQTHMCLEAAVRAAADNGFTCTVIADACATKDLKFGDRVVKADDVHASTLATLRAYATIMDAGQYLDKKP